MKKQKGGASKQKPVCKASVRCASNSLHLVDYKAEMSDDGKPSYYEAVISMNVICLRYFFELEDYEGLVWNVTVPAGETVTLSYDLRIHDMNS